MHIKSLLLLILLSLGLSSCHVGRFFIYNFSDIKDYQKFPEAEVPKGEEIFEFMKASDQTNSLNLPSAWPVKDDQYDFRFHCDPQ